MQPSEYMRQIAASGGTVASHIGELAGAEVKAAVKGAGIGSGLFAGAGFIGYTVLKICGIAVAFLLAWVFWAAAGLSVLMSLFLGFICVAFLGLLVMAVMALLGMRQFKGIHAPTDAVDEVKASIGALGPALADGVKDAEEALANAKVAPTQPSGPVANYVRDPLYLAKQRRANRS